MKAYLVCDPDLGCVVKLAETRSKARWAGASEMDIVGPYCGYPDGLFAVTVRRIPAYDDARDDDELYRRYWTDHDNETGEPVEAAA